MNQFHVFADSSCDLNEELVQKYDITLIPFYVTFDKKDYFKEGIEITIQEFYTKLRSENVFPSTSLPSTQDYIDMFRPCILSGKDVLCICLTSKFSGSYQSAVSAKGILEDVFPNANIEVIDSMQAAAGQALMVLEAAKMRDAGMSVSETAAEINEIKHTGRIILTVDSLQYLQKGGRIGLVSALAGGFLNIKPLIVLEDGELTPYGKVRGRRKAISKIIEMAIERVGNEVENYEFCVMHSDSHEECATMKNEFEQALGVKIDLPMLNLGTTIGAHIGPTVLGVAYVRKRNR